MLHNEAKGAMWSEVGEVGLKSKSESNKVFLAVPNGNAKFVFVQNARLVCSDSFGAIS